MKRLKNVMCLSCGKPIERVNERRYTMNGGPFHTSCEESSIIRQEDLIEPIEPLELLGKPLMRHEHIQDSPPVYRDPFNGERLYLRKDGLYPE